MAKRLVLIGATGWGNIGDDLIGDSILRAAKPFGFHVTLVGGPKDLTHPIAADKRISSVGGKLARASIAAAIARADIVAIGGGGLLEDRDGKFYRPFMRSAMLAHSLRKKVVLVGVGVGPLRRPETRVDFAKMMQSCDLVTTRDEESRARLLEVIPTADQSKVEVVLDPVLWPTSHAVTQGRLETTIDLAINLRPWTPALPDPGQAIESVPPLAAVVDSIATAIKETVPHGGRLAMVPMSELHSENDRAALQQLVERLTDYEIVWPQQINSEDVGGLIRQAKVVLTMRLHALIISRAAGVPTVGLTYDGKVAQQGRLTNAALLSLADAVNPASIVDALAQAEASAARPSPTPDDFDGICHRLFSTS